MAFDPLDNMVVPSNEVGRHVQRMDAGVDHEGCFQASPGGSQGNVAREEIAVYVVQGIDGLGGRSRMNPLAAGVIRD